MELAGGGRHAQLNASMVPCLAVFLPVCFLTIMAKSVQTSLDSVPGSQSLDDFWSNIFREAQLLCTPTRDCGDGSPDPLTQTSSQTSFSLTGPNSCPQQPVLQQQNRFGNVERAEGYNCLLQQLWESVGVSPSGETPKPSSYHKRSWWRAVKRACRHGKVRYKGRWTKIHEFPEHAVQVCKQQLLQDHATSSVRQAPTGSTGCSATGMSTDISYMSSNLGGLGSSRLDEALRWMDDTDVSVMCLQETRLSTSSTWKSGEISIIHSGAGGSSQTYCGVLVAVKSASEIRYLEVLPGRVLRVQAWFPKCDLPLEILCVYAPQVDALTRGLRTSS